MSARFIHPADLIADCGHPQWNGWQIVAALLVAATLAASVSGGDVLRSWRPGRPVRVSEIGRSIRMTRLPGRDGAA